MGAADASRRFAYCSYMVGTLPSRRLAVMSLYWQHLATPDVVAELFLIGLRTSNVPTSADVIRNCQNIVSFKLRHTERSNVFFIAQPSEIPPTERGCR